MDYINYLYYNGVLQNLHKKLDQKGGEPDTLNRAINAINSRMQEYESKPKNKTRSQYLKDHYLKHLPVATGIKNYH